MSGTPFRYKRLPGRGRRTRGLIPAAAAQSSLWLGEDHLLSVDRIWMNEEYKRFYFTDIQAITVEQTKTAMIWNWIFGALLAGSAVLFGLLAAHDLDARPVYLTFGGITAGIWLILLLINFFRGPSCICRLRTAVQTEVLPSLGRTGPARKALAILKPLIEQTQGVLAMGDMPAAAVIQPLPKMSGPALTGATQKGPPRLHPPASGLLHAALFGMLMIDAAAGVYAHLHPAWPFYFPGSGALLLAVTALSITALVKQRDTGVSEGLHGITVFTFIANMISLLVIFVYGFSSRMMYTIRHPGQLPYRIDFYGMAGFKTASFYADLGEFAIGIAGLILAAAHIVRQGRKPLPRAGAAPGDPARPIE